jgi:hypothetical protein
MKAGIYPERTKAYNHSTLLGLAVNNPYMTKLIETPNNDFNQRLRQSPKWKNNGLCVWE